MHNNISTLKSFTFYWLPVIAYAVLIFVQSSYPSPESIPAFPCMDKMLHGAGYALLAILFCRAYNTLKIKKKLALVLFVSLMSSTLYGVADEIHQYYVPYRTAELSDVLADFIGSFAGVLVYRLYVRQFMD